MVVGVQLRAVDHVQLDFVPPHAVAVGHNLERQRRLANTLRLEADE